MFPITIGTRFLKIKPKSNPVGDLSTIQMQSTIAQSFCCCCCCFNVIVRVMMEKEKDVGSLDGGISWAESNETEHIIP